MDKELRYNYNNHEERPKGNDKKVSEFERLLEDFNTQLSVMDSESTMILRKVYNIKNYSEPVKDDGESKSLKPEGVYNKLEYCLSTLILYNARLQEAREALSNLVG